jgi:hypothetical protein
VADRARPTKPHTQAELNGPSPDANGEGHDISRDEAIRRAEEELDEVTARLARQLRHLHPELFDADGELIESEYRRVITERFGRSGILTEKEIRRADEERRIASRKSRAADAT